MIYDIIIVGAGAAGLFAGINSPKELNKLILEKNDKPGVKVLLSGGERANVSNMDIEVNRDYFGQNKKALISIFKRYNQWDIMNFFADNGVKIVEEDRGRLILESGDSRELLEVLLREAKKNNCELRVGNDVKKISKKASPQPFPLEEREQEQLFEIVTDKGIKYKAKNVIVSSGGKSFFQVGTTGEGYSFAKEFGLNIITPYRTLCGMSTKKNLSEFSGVSCNLNMIVLDKNKKTIYSEKGPLLFTHFGISGPIVHNLSNAIGEFLNSLGLKENEFENYILDNLSLDLGFDLENTAKRLIKFFNLTSENNKVNIELQNWRSWKEAKATGGGVDINELDNNMQSKNNPGLYFIGEVVDVTGKTGGFNLQWAWSSGYVCGKSFK